MTPQLNGVALLLIAGYMTVVLFKGNTDALIALLSGEGKFLIWVIALVIVYWLWKSRAGGNIIGTIAGIGLLAAAFAVIRTGGVKDFVAKLGK